MKVVTAAAALDTGRYRPDSRVSGENGKETRPGYFNNVLLAEKTDEGAGHLATALAINPYVTGAARRHSQWMIDNDIEPALGSMPLRSSSRKGSNFP